MKTSRHDWIAANRCVLYDDAVVFIVVVVVVVVVVAVAAAAVVVVVVTAAVVCPRVRRCASADITIINTTIVIVLTIIIIVVYNAICISCGLDSVCVSAKPSETWSAWNPPPHVWWRRSRRRLCQRNNVADAPLFLAAGNFSSKVRYCATARFIRRVSRTIQYASVGIAFVQSKCGIGCLANSRNAVWTHNKFQSRRV